MAININNGIANITGTPGAYTGDFTNAPLPNAVANGTLFFDNVNGNIYQSDGGSWVTLSGGGGGSQNLQQVLNIGNTATNTNIQMTDATSGFTSLINTTSCAFRAEQGAYAGYLNPNEFAIVNIGINSVTIRPNEIAFYNTTFTNNFNFVLNNSAQFYTINGNVQYGLFIGLTSFISDFGDYANVAKGDYIRVDNNNEFIKTYMSNAEFGLFVDRTNQVFIGDYGGIGAGTLISIFDALAIIEIAASTRFTLYSGAAGLSATNGNTVIGDHDVVNNGSIFGVNDNNQKLIASSNLLVGSSGSASGQHLKINVGGNDYVIELKNP